ncbi:hypothetical protein [Actinomadura decatromicini]|uniref:hypothetical protein n=1 Tax=Actinomadura decatromicini TaxID=2604572 RepID=UPI001652F2D7|nr:hypothetical protein [Actinomadura decatromicini]
MRRHRRLAVLLRRRTELVVAWPRLRGAAAELVLRRRTVLVLLGGAELILLRRAELVALGRAAAVLVLGRLPVVLIARLLVLVLLRRVLLVGLRIGVGHRRLLLRLAPRVPLLLLLRLAPRVAGRLLPAGLAAVLLRLAVLGLLPVLRLPVLRLSVLRLSVLVGSLLLGRALLGHGRLAPRVLLLLRLAPRVGRLPRTGLALLRRLVLGGLVLGCLALRRAPRVLLLRLAVLGLAALLLRPAVRLAALPLLPLALRRRVAPLRVVVPARRLPLGPAGARQVGPAAHAEKIARLERLVTDRTVQGRHDTSPERTPARSSLDVRCSMSPLRGIPM